MGLFSIQDRERVRGRVLELASEDERVTAGAVVGSLAQTDGDRWSDVDLAFAVVDGVPVEDVLDNWTGRLVDEFAAVALVDLPRGSAIYRVFLFPGCLQVDLSFRPASEFATGGSNFRLLFGKAEETPEAPPPDPRELFGWAVHHALRARICIERGRYLQAEYWISGVRDDALSLACRARGLPAYYGRGFDDLPPDVRDSLASALVASFDRDELLRALGCAVEGLLRHADEVGELAGAVEATLRTLTTHWDE